MTCSELIEKLLEFRGDAEVTVKVPSLSHIWLCEVESVKQVERKLSGATVVIEIDE